MKRRIFICFSLLFATVTMTQGAEKVLVDQAFTAGGQLHLLHVIGEVNIKGTASDYVRIVEEVSDYSRRSRSPEFSTVKIDGNTIIISARPGSEDYHEITAEVPTYFSVAVEGAGGDINIRELTGEVFIHISGGDTELENIRGKVTVETSAGDVYMQDIQGRVSVTTQGGDLDLKQFYGNVSLENNAGDISITEGTGNVKIQSGSGDLFVGALKGDSLWVNLKAGDLQVEDYQGRGIFVLKFGDVEIEEMSGKLDVDLDIGNLAIHRLMGSLDARMKIGELEVESHSGNGRVSIDRGDVEYDWAVESPTQDDSLWIESKLGSVALWLPSHINPSLLLESSEEAQGLERFSGEVQGSQRYLNRYVYKYKGDTGKVKISTKIGQIRIYER